jgi:hypothetical protein
MNLEGNIVGYNKKILIITFSFLIVAGIFFYAGAKYEKYKLMSLGLLIENEGELSIKGFLTEKNDNGIILKMEDGDLREISYNNTLTFGVKKDGTKDDLLVGQLLVVTGENNPDGKFVAENIRRSKKSPKIKNQTENEDR